MSLVIRECYVNYLVEKDCLEPNAMKHVDNVGTKTSATISTDLVLLGVLQDFKEICVIKSVTWDRMVMIVIKHVDIVVT